MGPTIRFEKPGQLAMYLDAHSAVVWSLAFDPTKHGKATHVSAEEMVRKPMEMVEKRKEPPAE